MFQDAVPEAIRPIAASTGPSTRDGVMLAWDEVPAILLRRARWILGGLFATLLAALFVVALLPPTYTANTEIVVQPTDLKAVDGSVNQTSSEPDTSVALVETAARVIRSSRVLNDVVAKLGLANDPEFARSPSRLGGLAAAVRNALHLDTHPAALVDPAASAVQQLAKQLTVRRSERTFVIDLSVKSKDPVKAAAIANALVDAFMSVQADARAEASRRISDALTSRLGELRDSVRRNEEAVQTFRAAHNLTVANGQLVNEQQLSEVSTQLLEAQNHTSDAKAKLDQVEAAAHSRDPGALPETLQSPTVASLRGQIAAAGKQEADARTTLGDRHPQLAQLRSQGEALRRALDAEIQRIRDSARVEYERARSSESNLRASLARQQARGTQADAAQIRLRELERDAEASRSVYQAFLVRARETAEQERLDTLNAWVMSPAVAPSDRTFPPSNTVLFGGALPLGLLIGLGLALVRERLDPRLRTWRRVSAVTGLPILATLDGPRRRLFKIGTKGSEPAAIDIQRGANRMLALVRDLGASRNLATGRIVLLLGTRTGEDIALAARCIEAAAVADGLKTTLVRLGPVAGKSESETERSTVLDLVEPTKAWEVPLLIERLKRAQAETGSLMIVAGQKGTLAMPQLTALADAIVIVLRLGRSTRAEARTMARDATGKAGVLRGALLVQGTT